MNAPIKAAPLYTPNKRNPFGKALDVSNSYTSFDYYTDAPRHICNKAVDYAGLANGNRTPARVYKWMAYLISYGYQARCPFNFIKWTDRRDIKHRQEMIRRYGVHITADWDDGGSDAVDLPIHNLREFCDYFDADDPTLRISTHHAGIFFRGLQDFVVIRRWTDPQGRDVTDTMYVPNPETF